MKEYLHDGTTIHTKIYYVLHRGKRQYTEKKPQPTTVKKTIFEFEAFMYPPLMLLPHTWKRYNYTIEDVVSTFDRMDASFVWGISLMLLAGTYEPEAASAGVRSTFQSPFTFLFISRKTVFDVFLSTQHDSIDKTSNRSVLCRERSDHRPLIPKIDVGLEVFNQLLKIVPKRHPSFIWHPIYPFYHVFKDIMLIPISYDKTNNLIYMNRIIEEDTYNLIPIQPKTCLITLPIKVTIEHKKYVVIEEACFFTSSLSTLKISKKRGNANKMKKLPTAKKKRRICR